jgi:hypothetical protein
MTTFLVVLGGTLAVLAVQFLIARVLGFCARGDTDRYGDGR